MDAKRWLSILGWSLWLLAAGACHSHTGGDEGNGGSAGSNELVPATSNIFVTQFSQTAASKVDLLVAMPTWRAGSGHSRTVVFLR